MPRPLGMCAFKAGWVGVASWTGHDLDEVRHRQTGFAQVTAWVLNWV